MPSVVIGGATVSYSSAYFAKNGGQLLITSDTCDYVDVYFPEISAVAETRYNFPVSGKVHVLLGDVFRVMLENGFAGGDATIAVKPSGVAIGREIKLKIWPGTMPIRNIIGTIVPPSNVMPFNIGLPTEVSVNVTQVGKYAVVLADGAELPSATPADTAKVDALGNASVSISSYDSTAGAKYRIVLADYSGETPLVVSEIWRGGVPTCINQLTCAPMVYVEWLSDSGRQKSWIFECTDVVRTTSDSLTLQGDDPSNYYDGSFFAEVRNFGISIKAKVRNVTAEEAGYFDDLATSSRVYCIPSEINYLSLAAYQLGEHPLARVKSKNITRTIDAKRRDLTFEFDVLRCFNY